MNETPGTISACGYFSISITSYTHRQLMSTNDERSFVISFLQKTLSYKPYVPADSQQEIAIALHVDLLAFSITQNCIELLVFSTLPTAKKLLIELLLQNLEWYQAEFSPYGKLFSPHVTTRRLRGPHHALEYSALLHVRHKDWEYDRYSSVGFYLHDRRGGWMRLWRMAKLYENNTENYRRFLVSHLHTTAQDFVATS